MSFITQFTNRTEVELTDKAVGHRGTASGAESGWTWQVVKDWILTWAAPLSHTTNQSNPHAVSKAQVGLGSANDTADAAKPVSTAQAAADTAVANAAAAALAAHVALDNPHGTTKAGIGLGDVDNTPDAAKPISAPTQAALDLRLTSASALAAANLTGTISPARLASGFGLQVLRRNAANTALEFTSLSLGAGTGDLIAANNLSEIPSKPTARTNLGIGSVDNTADMAKPVSTAQAAAIAVVQANVVLAQGDADDAVVAATAAGVSAAAATVTANAASATATSASATATSAAAALAAHEVLTNNPHAVTKTQVGLANVTNDAQLKSGDLDIDAAMAADSDTKIASQKAVKTALAGKFATADLDIDATMAANSDTKVATQKAVKTALAGKISDPTTTDGDIIIRTGGVLSRRAAGADTFVLTMVGGVPDWAASAGGGGGGGTADIRDIWGFA